MTSSAATPEPGERGSPGKPARLRRDRREHARQRLEQAALAARLLQAQRCAEAEPVLRGLLTPQANTRDVADAWLLASNAWARDPQEQLRHLNAFLQCHSLPPVALADESRPPSPLNLRTAAPVPARAHGPLVSVIMTAFDSAARIEAAIASVLAQSWRPLELIVVDDASSDATAQRVAAMAARDGRVKLLRLAHNAGTYAAKHIGLQHARGEFVTCHDSDDWSHPLKIERQLAPLLARPALVCTSSCWVRMDDEGVYHARQVYPLMRWNPSSPLFRRERVLAEAGAWDVVRTGADSEFLDRLRCVFGAPAVLRVSEPLALGSQRADSLMTAPGTGYDAQGESPDRRAYMVAWRRWHADCVEHGARPFIAADAVAAAWQRPFAVPGTLRVNPQAVAANTQDAGVPGFAATASKLRRWVAMSSAIADLPTLAPMLEGEVLRPGRGLPRERIAGVLAWGRKPSAQRAEAWAGRHGLPVLRLEDGFLRSFGTGERHPPLSLVADAVGIYYDSTRPSALENLLNADIDPLEGIAADVARARALIATHGLAKYNHAPPWRGPPGPRAEGEQRVLVVDQTAGDLSVSLGAADAGTFAAMLAAARAENPGATVYVKTHPEVTSGRKGGYLTQVQDDASTVVLREAIEPASLFAHMDKVYVVSSTLGFEAMLAGKPVTCFGLPWYAGWGATDDRQTCTRRLRRHSVDSLFAAAYFHYARYLDPETFQRGTIFHVIDWLARQRRMARERPPSIAVGLRRWKAHNLEPLLSLQPGGVRFADDAAQARAMHPAPGTELLQWGAAPSPELEQLAQESGARLMRMEDGFVRSVGLGSDLIRPWSLVLEAKALYFDPRTPSGLEDLLATRAFTPADLAEAARVRAYIVEHGLTKYNHEPRERANWPTAGRPVVLVPGQVEDDASIRLGCTLVRTNLDLLRTARVACPGAFIVYKPHPDVTSGNRIGQVPHPQALAFADHVEDRLSVVSCIEACDELHTMTSLAGFDALLRGKRVVTHGQPFYAGWGLTDDRAEGGAALARRNRRLTLDELVAGALLHYPLYWDWRLCGYTHCMAVLHALAEQRDALAAQGRLGRLKKGWWQRRWRKAQGLLRALRPSILLKPLKALKGLKGLRS